MRFGVIPLRPTSGPGVAQRGLTACRPGYVGEFDEAVWWIRCVDGSVHRPDGLSSAVHAEAKALFHLLARKAP